MRANVLMRKAPVLVMTLCLIITVAVPASPAYARVPDQVAIDFPLAVNVLKIDIEPGSQWQNQERAGAKICLENPAYTLYLAYNIRPESGGGVAYSPVSEADAFWSQWGLVPPKTTICYWVEVTDTDQVTIIENNLLDAKLDFIHL